MNAARFHSSRQFIPPPTDSRSHRARVRTGCAFPPDFMLRGFLRRARGLKCLTLVFPTSSSTAVQSIWNLHQRITMVCQCAGKGERLGKE